MVNPKYESHLGLSEGQLRALVHASVDVLYRMSPDWAEMRNLGGGGFISDTEEPDPEWLRKYIHPEDQNEVWKTIQEAIRTKSLFELEHRVWRADGSLGWTFSRAVPILDQTGEIAEWFGAASDITQRKWGELALRESEERHRLFVENVREYAFIQSDLNGYVTSWNPSADRLFGYAETEMLGQSLSLLFTPEDQAASVFDRELACIQKGERNEDARWLVRRDGTRLWARWVTEPVRDEAGNLRGAAKILRDETERQRANEVMQQRQKLESIGLLAGGIAHDFNNILTGIMGNASLVLDQVSPGPRKRITEIVKAAERAAHLTKQLLAYSGQGQFVLQDLNVSDVLRDVDELVHFSIPKNVRMAVIEERRLPLVRMDLGQLQQILMNLVINAGEAIGEGNAGTITITTAVTEAGQAFVDAIGQEIAVGRYVSIEVRDTGSGIDEDKKSKIFDPFFTTKFTGRGLGLAAVAGIVRTQRGAILLESEPGRGSAFRVLLPVAENDTLSADQPVPETRGTVLIVDDELSVLDFIAAVLRRDGYRVLLASEGREAIAICEREDGNIAAIILDVVMPVMSSTELLPVLRVWCPRAKILLTSGYSEFEAKRLCAAFPECAFIQKPYTAQQIASTVENLLCLNKRLSASTSMETH